MIATCAKCGKMFETSEEDACTPGTVCPACYRPDGCSSCHYLNPVGGLAEYTTSTREKAFLCQLCAGTFAGNRVLYHNAPSPDHHVLQAVCWVGNRLRDDLRTGRDVTKG